MFKTLRTQFQRNTSRMVHTLVTASDPKPSAPYVKCYSLPTPNGIKATFFLELLGIDYYVQKIDFGKNEQKEDWYLKMNPNGKIPTLEVADQNGKVTYISESAAILIYLADKYDTERKYSYGPSSPLYYEQLEWMFFQMAGLGPMKGQYHHFAFFAPEKIEYGIKRYHDETIRLFGVLEERLKRNGTGYLVGDHLSLADITTYPWVDSGKLSMKETEEFPEMSAWIKRIGALPESQRARQIPPFTMK